MNFTSKYTSILSSPRVWNYFKEGISGYSFRFNGKENDKEGMGGGGSTYDYGFRIYKSNKREGVTTLNYEIQSFEDKPAQYRVKDNYVRIDVFKAINRVSNSYVSPQYSAFANELRDVKYYFENVKDGPSFILWENSGDHKSEFYYSNEKGAGHYSREYEKDRIQDVKNLKKPKDENGNIVEEVK